MDRPGGEHVPKAMLPTYEAVVALTDAFCNERLNGEYAALCRKAAAGLARKRPSPLLSGKLQTWAGGIVYAMASQNFLFDKSEPLYMSAGDVAAGFGIGQSTASSKAKAVRDALKISQLDWRWYLPSRLGDFSPAWMVEVNGFIMDARRLPRAIQEEAFQRGLIPYLPGPPEQG